MVHRSYYNSSWGGLECVYQISCQPTKQLLRCFSQTHDGEPRGCNSGKVWGLTTWLRFILWKPWMSETKLHNNPSNSGWDVSDWTEAVHRPQQRQSHAAERHRVRVTCWTAADLFHVGPVCSKMSVTVNLLMQHRHRLSCDWTVLPHNVHSCTIFLFRSLLINQENRKSSSSCADECVDATEAFLWTYMRQTFL